ncbi:alpha/beta fold hydrolase [Shimia sagamensis]|uniref:Pimeloyl-ACP methyl ester carboxylesterase n=1 Tax=Shimia sagamensis TaxID=1566352 RepID=A0ABY1P0W1_9RHOB|nr:alpha/beta hydrolase [Shimia sagamensis]SMP23677.1 Pimeloyl-ACP methyl ester carboxylesterase [Shimia sagamensis]
MVTVIDRPDVTLAALYLTASLRLMQMTWHSTALTDGTAAAWQNASTGPTVVFHHATALGPRCYAPFLSNLGTTYHLKALAMRTLWQDAPPPNRKREWDLFADDLIEWIEATQDTPILAMGHSIGAATTAMAAVKRPDLFKGLVLIEPSGVTRRIRLLLKMIPYRLRQSKGPAAEVLNGPTHWPHLEAAFAYYRASKAYRRFDDATLRGLIDALTVATDTGIRLEYPRNWEAHLYATPPLILPTLKRLCVPTEVIIGKPSLFMDPSIARSLRDSRPDMTFQSLPDYGHLLPLEAPTQVAAAARTALDRLA